MKYLLIAGMLALGACAGTVETRGTNALAIACDTYATVLDQLTPLRRENKIPDDMERRVNAANSAVDTVCLPGSPVDPADAIGTVREGIDLLKSVKEAL